jgi:Phage capsid family
MSSERTFPWGEDPSEDDDGMERPYGTKPYGTKPYGTKPYGTKPYGTKPYGTKPYGTKPYGTKPYGTKPYGTKPYGTKPYGTKEDGDDGGLDPLEWSMDVVEVFGARCALIRLGARFVPGDHELPIPSATPVVGQSSAARVQTLRPMEHQLAFEVTLANKDVTKLGERPELASALKEDIGSALARNADAAFLNAIRDGAGGAPDGAPALLDLLRWMIATLRERSEPRFACPGWVLSPGTLDALTKLQVGGHSLDETRLLTLDGEDGGMLLGYPFIVSAAAEREGQSTIVLASDWDEAWVGTGPGLATVEVSAAAHFDAGQTGLRAVLYHDLVLREPACFVAVQLPAGDG